MLLPLPAGAYAGTLGGERGDQIASCAAPWPAAVRLLRAGRVPDPYGRNWSCQMDEKTRRTLEMAERALEFGRARPESSPECAANVARVEARIARVNELVELQERIAPPDPAA